MTKAFSILHRAAALLVALCLLIGMALPVYAAEDGALFFDAGSETIPTIPAANTASEGVEPAQETIVSDLETVPDEGDTPPTANEPGTEAGNTVNNTAAVPNNDGKPQETAETPTPAADKDAAPAETSSAPADLTLTNKAPDGQATTAPDTAVTPDNTADAKKNAAAKANTEQDNLFDDGDNPNEEDTMLADDLPDNDDANAPDTTADTSASQGFIPTTATIYFEDDGTYDTYVTENQNCTIRFLAQNICSDNKTANIDKVMTLTEMADNNHKIFSVTLNSADYPEGGFYRLVFQYYVNNNHDWKEEIYAFGNTNAETTKTRWTAIDQLAGKKFVRERITDTGGWDCHHYNLNSSYNATQWTRVEYYYKGTPLYFKNASGTALTNVTATFYKLENGTPLRIGSQTIGTVDAGKLAAQQILIPDNQSRFVQFSWSGGQSALYDFTTDYTAAPYAGTQELDLTAANCFVCNGTDGTWAIAGSDLLTADKKIYFDATLSAYSYAGEGLQQSAMGDGENMYCFLTSSDGVTSLQMTKETPDTKATDRKLWFCEIPNDGKTYTAVQFSATADQNTPAKDNKTIVYSTAKIPPNLQEPCFFADDGDPSAYTGDNVNRDGYWGEKSSVRDAEGGKNTTVVDIASGDFTQESGTKYITSTLYDYYTDYELNGFNRDSAPIIGDSSQRLFVTFEQFDRALSSAYRNNDNVKYPLYTGHFQPSIWGNRFADVAPGMDLYGWGDEGSSDYNTFMAVNNSALDDKGGRIENVYDRTFQGLVEGTTSTDGLPLLRTKNSTGSATTALADPHFNKDFLQGKNTFNTVLGKVYEDVSFPLKKSCVFAQNPNNPADDDPEGKAEYWYYDSSKSSLYLKQNQTDGKYYLESTTDSSGNPITDSKSQNISAPNNANGTYGFFPFNQTVNTVGASQYNYGFGAKLQFDFTLTDNGRVIVGKDGSGKNIEVPIKFFFSGDDDVWVYIDGDLVLDVGGAHDAASGLLEFGENNTVIPYVSSNKNTDSNDPMVYKGYEPGETTKTVKYNDQSITFNKKGTQKTLKNQTTHTLTMYYMERGMWESNMALAFNFPDHNELQVEKKVDVSDVNPLFQKSFKNQKIFTFNIQNLATHYGTTAAYTPTIETYGLPDNVYSSATRLSYESLPSEVGTGSAVLWSSNMNDPTSKYRAERRGTLTLDSAKNISPFSYLTFDVYVQGDSSETCALSNLYVELWDTDDKQMGCLGTKGLQSSDVYGAATALHPGTWYTIRLMLNSLKKDEHFNNQLTKITVGDNYNRSIYLRNFTFSSAPTLPKQTGFTTAQYDVPDYGSAESGKLANAAFAVFSSNLGNGDVVDENGQFLLQDGETATFSDQFRRGSYIALQEQIDTELYDTSWTVYENGVPVTSVGGKPDVVEKGSVDTLKNIGTTAPNDDRTEQVVNEHLDGHDTQNAYTVDRKPSTALVFRSYSSTADANELTKLKVVFTNKVKTGKLVIRKVPAEGETLEGKTFTFTVRFGDVGGQSLGDTIDPIQYECTVEKHGDGYYGQIVIDKIPVGTRFVVSENVPANTSLKKVSIEGGKDCKVSADGVNAYGAIAEGDMKAATATFVNSAHELIDITVKKEWEKQDQGGTVDIPQADLPDAIYLRLQRTETPEDPNSWNPVPGHEREELHPTDYQGWTKQFIGLDKTGPDRKPYTYRVLESATGQEGDWHGGTDGDVIRIDGKKYKVLNTTVTGNSDDKTLTLNLTNQLQDAEYKLVITKQDAQDAAKKLGGVEFRLEKLDGTSVTETTPGTTATGTGLLTFENLTPGSYRLTETKTAEGYTLLAEPIEFTLTADGKKCQRSNGESITVNQDTTSGVYNIALTIYNRKGFTLPHTGADAPSLWLLIGLPALVAVLLVLVFRYNKKGGKRS